MLKAVPLERRVRESKSQVPPKAGMAPCSTGFITGNIDYILKDFKFDIDLTPVRQAFEAREPNLFASYDSENDWAQRVYDSRTCRLVVTISNNEEVLVELVAMLKDPFTKREVRVDLRPFAKGFLLTNAYGQSINMPFDGNDNGATRPYVRLAENRYQVTLDR